MKILCWLKTIWRSLKRDAFFVDFIGVSGHDYVEVLEDKEKQILKCKVCGQEDIGYY